MVKLFCGLYIFFFTEASTDRSNCNLTIFRFEIIHLPLSEKLEDAFNITVKVPEEKEEMNIFEKILSLKNCSLSK